MAQAARRRNIAFTAPQGPKPRRERPCSIHLQCPHDTLSGTPFSWCECSSMQGTTLGRPLQAVSMLIAIHDPSPRYSAHALIVDARNPHCAIDFAIRLAIHSPGPCSRLYAKQQSAASQRQHLDVSCMRRTCLLIDSYGKHFSLPSQCSPQHSLPSQEPLLVLHVTFTPVLAYLRAPGLPSECSLRCHR